jgi:hypothetical protein
MACLDAAEGAVVTVFRARFCLKLPHPLLVAEQLACKKKKKRKKAPRHVSAICMGGLLETFLIGRLINIHVRHVRVQRQQREGGREGGREGARGS